MSDDRQFIDQLNDAGRVLQQARMLPMTQPLTDEQIDQVRRDYIAYTNDNAVWDAQVGKQINRAPSVLSDFRAGKYTGDNEKVARILNDWMERHRRARKSSLPVDYVPTQIAEDIRTIAGVAHDTTSIAAIVAPSGSGKTMVLEILADEMRGVYLYCDEDMSSRSFLIALARAVGVRGVRSNRYEIKGEIIERLRGTNRPIFLDEAHRLPQDVFPRLRSIHDQAQVAIIAAGTHEILNRIDDTSNGRGQLASRCLKYNALVTAVNAEDPDNGRRQGRPLFTHEEIRQVFARMKVKLDPDAFMFLWAVACLPNRGCIRTMRRAVQLCLKQAPDQAITVKRAKNALKLLFSGEGALISTAAERHVEIFAKAG